VVKLLEDDFQVKFMNLIADIYPKIYDVTLHIANERKTKTKKNKSGKIYSPEGVRLKRKGVKPGVPDNLIAYPCGGKAGFFIELKVQKLVGVYQRGERKGEPKYEITYPSEDQKHLLYRFYELGYAVDVCWNLDQVRLALDAYLAGVHTPCKYVQNNIIKEIA
jgi:hypothetical protein